MEKPTVFMFSGQGSQYFHMGQDLFEHEPIFRHWMSKIDQMVIEMGGESVIHSLYSQERKKSDWFDSLDYSHPAIFMVEYSVAQVFIEQGLQPDYLIGASLGELTGAVISKAITLEDAVNLVVNQCDVFNQTCQQGVMAAILGPVDLFYQTPILKNNSELAAINFDSHFVISTDIAHFPLISSFLTGNDINYQKLPVNFAFHASWINPAQDHFLNILNRITYRLPQIPLISCMNGRHGNTINAAYFWQVIRQPILFQQAVQNLEQQGSYFYVDLGPSGTLATFVKYLLPQTSASQSAAILPLLGNERDSLKTVTDQLQREKIKTVEMKKKEKHMLAYIFPGQGSQKKRMGKELFDKYAELTAKTDAILGYSIKELCTEDPDNNLGKTQYTQPALFTVNALMYYHEIEQTGNKPDFLAGHSLGEYNALLAAEVFDFETGLKLVQKRGELMARAKGGGMAAVIGLDEQQVKAIIEQNNIQNLYIANYNTPTQIVIAGQKDSILDAKPLFEAGGARLYIRLKVSGAFHTHYMETATDEFSSFLNGFKFSPPQIPVISNLEARPYTPSQLKTNLIKQITNSVRWTDSIRYLMGKGDIEFKEIGPGNVLKGLVAKIQAEAEPLFIDEQTEDTSQESPSDQAPEPENQSTSNPTVSMDAAFPQISLASLGSASFKKDYGLKYAYLSGAMYKGIASKDIVACMGNAGLMGFLGTGGMPLDWIEKTIIEMKKDLKKGAAFGLNLLNSPLEEATVDIYLKHAIHRIEAAAYLQMTPGLVRYRLKGVSQNADGTLHLKNKILAKVSRPEVAEVFLSPAPERIVNNLIEAGHVTPTQAEWARNVPMADDICVEADSGGHTDQGVLSTLFPAMLKLREEMKQKYGYPNDIRLGAAGGIGTPEAAASAFILGADFILTGSINQCTVEAGISDMVKDMLQTINVQDTDYAPAGDMFEMGAKVQVLRKGVFFPARANKLYALYQQFNSIDEIDEKTKRQLQDKYFKKSFEDIYADCKSFYPQSEIVKAENNPKHKMALIFKWYFGYTTQLSLSGNEQERVNFQVHCGPALGAFNQWVKGTELEDWRHRHVDQIAEKLMEATAALLNKRFRELAGT